MTDRLKPCPFCDGEAEIKHQELNWFVRCKYCFCRTAMHTTEFFARCSWNTRKPMDKIAERLKEAKGKPYTDGVHTYNENDFIDIDKAIEIVKRGE